MSRGSVIAVMADYYVIFLNLSGQMVGNLRFLTQLFSFIIQK